MSEEAPRDVTVPSVPADVEVTVPGGTSGGIGLPGPTGPTGPAGPAGATGPTGPAGPNAVSADAGNIAVLGSDSKVYVPPGGSAPPVDGPAGTPSLRTLGTTSTQAAAGNDTRFGTGVAGTLVNDTLIWNGSGFVSQHIGEESLLAPLWIEIPSRVDIPVIDSLLSANLTSIASGTIYYTYFIPRKNLTISRLGVYVTVSATGTPTLARMGLYTCDASQNLTRVAHTPNTPTMFTAAPGPVESLLASTNLDGTPGSWPLSYNLVRGSMYALATINVGGTAQPNFRGLSVLAGATGRLPYKNLAHTAQADLSGGNASPATPVVATSLATSSLLVAGFARS